MPKSKALRVFALKPIGVGFAMMHRLSFEFTRMIAIIAVSALITAAMLMTITGSEGGRAGSLGRSDRQVGSTHSR